VCVDCFALWFFFSFSFHVNRFTPVDLFPFRLSPKTPKRNGLSSIPFLSDPSLAHLFRRGMLYVYMYIVLPTPIPPQFGKKICKKKGECIYTKVNGHLHRPLGTQHRTPPPPHSHKTSKKRTHAHVKPKTMSSKSLSPLKKAA
jgi:hypothetical protein